jgi:hypothetical protein
MVVTCFLQTPFVVFKNNEFIQIVPSLKIIRSPKKSLSRTENLFCHQVSIGTLNRYNLT